MARKGSIGHVQLMDRSPTHCRPPLNCKRRRSTVEFDSASDSIDDGGDHEGGDDRRRLPGVKRACNECRQQKLRCDVVQDPFTQCSRCRRLKLECKIESTFKRVGKRSRNAEMERELLELRRQLESSSAQHSPTGSRPPSLAMAGTAMEASASTSASASATVGAGHQLPLRQDLCMRSDEAVASLLDLRQGLEGGSGYFRSPNGLEPFARTLEGVVVPGDRIAELFHQFFDSYHPLLPLLDRSKPPDYYHDSCPLLFWAVVSIASRRDAPLFAALAPKVSRLVWSTLGEIPHTSHVVKALCLLCTWPFPVSTTSADATFMWCGIMMQVAMQIGLHRPSFAQDFTRFHIQLRDEDLKDRVKTWAACNIVAQCVATGYGQRPWTLYDWTLDPGALKDPSYLLPEELSHRVQIERFCDKVTKALYSNPTDPVGLTKADERHILCNLLARDFDELEARIGPVAPDVPPPVGQVIDTLHLRAAELHLRLSALFDASPSRSSSPDLSKLYLAAKSFVGRLLSLEGTDTPLLRYATNYILQITVASGFTLHKLLNSPLAAHLDREEGKDVFKGTIRAIRQMSVVDNDLPARLAEVLVQLWRGGGAGEAHHFAERHWTDLEGSLMLKVRCRMSMSLVYDSVWRWREEFQARTRCNLDSAVQNPTDPDTSAAEASSSSTAMAAVNGDSSLLPHGQSFLMATTAANTPTMVATPGAMNGGTAATSGANGALLNLAPARSPNAHAAPLLHPLTTSTTPSINSANFTGGGGCNNALLTEPTYEVFDPLNWMLDGFVDFPFQPNGMQPLGAEGLA